MHHEIELSAKKVSPRQVLCIHTFMISLTRASVEELCTAITEVCNFFLFTCKTEGMI